MKKRVAKHSKSGSLVMDGFDGNLAAARACLLLNTDIRFIGCDIEADCLDVFFPGFSIVFGRQSMDEYLDITDDYNVQESALGMYQRWEVQKKRRSPQWMVPRVWTQVQRYRIHIVSFLFNLHATFSLSDRGECSLAQMFRHMAASAGNFELPSVSGS